MKRSIVAFSLLVVLSLAIPAGAEITIGVNLSTTGPGAALGISEKNAVTFGPSTIAGEKVRYVILDDTSDPTIALQNAKRLVTEEKIDILIGSTLAACVFATMDTLVEAKTPAIALTPTTGIVLPMDAKRKWMFKTVPNDDIYNIAMVRHMLNNGVKTAAVITTDDSYGEGQTSSFQRVAEQKGVKIETIEKFKRTDTSTLPQILRIIKSNPDAVFIVAAGTPAVLPHSTLVERGYKGKIYQSGGSANADFLRVGGKIVEGSFVTALPLIAAEQLPDGYPTKAEALRFWKTYEAKFGTPSLMAGHTWDALLIIEAAVPKALKTGAKPGTEQFRSALRDALEQTDGLRGAGAVFRMSASDHVGINDMAVLQIQNGKWKLVQMAEFK
jgi:branched-chain amino acid transport system substrate-binding protein